MESEESKLRKEAPFLFSLKKENVHTVPDGFFSELEKDVRRTFPKRKRGIWIRMKRWTRVSVAAAIVLLIVFSGIKMVIDKQYVPAETIRTMYTVMDGDMDGE